MPERIIFIDESGDLGKLGSRYFVIAALCTNDAKPIYNAMKRIKERKLKKKTIKLSELKANRSDDIIRKAVLNKLMACDCEFHILVLDKKKVYSYLFEKKNKLYNYLAGILFEHAQGNAEKTHVIIDKKDNKSVIRDDFNNYLKNNKASSKTTIEHINSQDNRGLQAVDFVAWSVHRKFNFNDDSFYKIIESKIARLHKLFVEK